MATKANLWAAAILSAIEAIICPADRISSKFHFWMASIKISFKFEYGFNPMNDNQDGQQNGRRLSVFTVVTTLT